MTKSAMDSDTTLFSEETGFAIHPARGLVTHLRHDGVRTPYELGKDSGNEPE